MRWGRCGGLPLGLPGALVAVLLGLVLGAPAASAHSDLESSSPADGASLTAPPAEVVLVLAEAPAAGSQAVVSDGCGRDVTQQVRLDGEVLTATVATGAPGGWTVDYALLSDVDGHLVQGRIAFTVEGAADCSATTEDLTAPTAAAAEGSRSTWPLLVGAALVLGAGAGVGLALRRRHA